MPMMSEGHERLRTVATVALTVDAVGFVGAWIFGAYTLAAYDVPLVGLAFLAGGLLALVVGLLLYCQVLLLYKFVRYSYRAHEALLAAAELQRRQEEFLRTIADNSNLSDWAKRIVYREKDFEFLRDAISAAIVRQDWEAADHLIQDVDTQFGYHDEAARFRDQLEQARKATTEERIAAVLARFEKLCDEHRWEQARRDCKRLQTLFPDEARIAALPDEIESRRQEVKQELLHQYEEAVQNEDIDRAHRLLFELDQYIVPQEAEALKESARNVFRARLEQLKTRFSIAVSYKQFNNAIAAGQQLMREFPNSGYAHQIAKLMPVLHERVKHQPSAHAPAQSGSHSAG